MKAQLLLTLDPVHKRNFRQACKDRGLTMSTVLIILINKFLSGNIEL